MILLTKSTENIILTHQHNLLFAPRRISPWASDGVIYFMGTEDKRGRMLRSQFETLKKEGI